MLDLSRIKITEKPANLSDKKTESVTELSITLAKDMKGTGAQSVKTVTKSSNYIKVGQDALKDSGVKESRKLMFPMEIDGVHWVLYVDSAYWEELLYEHGSRYKVDEQ